MKLNIKFDKRFLIIFLSLLFMFLLMNSARWTYHTFQRVNFDEIGIVLNSGIGTGTDPDLLKSFLKKVLWRSLLHSLLITIICQMFRKKLILVITYILVSALLIQKLCTSNIQLGSFFNFETSNFYEQEFIAPEETPIKWTEHRNVLFIALESIEKVYGTPEFTNEILTPNITRLERDNISFENYRSISGLSHTIAAITGFTTGLPLFYSGYRNTDKMVGAYGIGKIFKSAGYQTWSIFPASGTFSFKSRFMQRMGFDTIIDGEQIRKNLINPPEVAPFYGVDDGTLFEYSKPIIQRIMNSKKPYFIFMETINTHIDGYFTEFCKNIGFEQNNYSDIIKCDDKIIYDFVKWFRAQDPSAVVILVNDHNYGGKQFLSQFRKTTNRSLSNVFINTPVFNKTDKSRPVSSMDFFPSVIEAAGGQIQGCKLGLGTSMAARCSTTQTLRERFSDETLEKKLEQKNNLYYKLATGRNKK